MKPFNYISVCILFVCTTACVAVNYQINPLPANGNIYISDSGIGGIVEIDRTTYAPITFHLNQPTGDMKFSPSGALYVNDSDNRYNIHPDFTNHNYNTNEQPMTGSWVLQDDKTLITATMGGAEVNGGLIRIFDLNNDGQANGYNEATRYISATNVNTLAFKGQNFSNVYFIQSNTGIMFQAPWQQNGASTLFAVNSLLQNSKFLTYHSNGNFYALKDNNILQIAGDGSAISTLFGAGQSPLVDPVQLTIGYDNNLYVADNGRDNLFKISPATLQTTALLQPGLFSNLRGVAIAPIPEPATLMLLGLGGMMIRKFKSKS